MPLTLNDWFCLHQDRHNYRPRIPEDCNLIFCHDQTINDEIIRSIEMQFAVNDPVKMILHGDYGVGKTHCIHYIDWWLDQHKADYPAEPVVITIGDIAKNSRFDVIVRPILERLGLDSLVNLAHAYLPHSGNNFVGALQAAGIPDHIAQAYHKLLMAAPGQTPPQLVLFALEYLKGRKLPAAAAGMGIAGQLSESLDFYYVLAALGEMYMAVHGHRLLFIADEAEELEVVTADDITTAHWVNTNRLIFDDNNRSFGFVYTISARRGRMPASLWEPQLQNRLGDKVFELQTLDHQDVDQFLTRLVEAFTDRQKVDALVQAGTIDPNEYRWEDYPFTASARRDFIDYFQRTQEDAKPRDICKKLDDVAFIAGKQNKRLIDDDCLRAAHM